jgi:CheY-like chemotaxis protein
VKIFICCESAPARDTLRAALEAASHEVVVAAQPAALVATAPDAGALLVDPAQAQRTIALLRDRGFSGRALVTADRGQELLAKQAPEVGADGALALSPRADLARRFAVAIGGRRRVLVVDDSEIVSRLLRAELEKAGFEVYAAQNVETAMGVLLKRATRPDLMLLDINMPRVSGVQFCRFIKTNDRFRAIKVVLCSGEDKSRVASLAGECGADGIVSKHDVLGKWIVDNT